MADGGNDHAIKLISLVSQYSNTDAILTEGYSTAAYTMGNKIRSIIILIVLRVIGLTSCARQDLVVQAMIQKKRKKCVILK